MSSRLRACVLFAFAVAAGAQEEHPVHWSARQSLVTIRSGDTARVTLRATIGEYFHLYSTTQRSGGPIRTTLGLAPHDKYSLIGRIRAPAPDTIPDRNFGIMTEVYDDSVTLGLTVRARPGLRAGRDVATVGIRYQACTARYCLPPRVDTVTISLLVTVRP